MHFELSPLILWIDLWIVNTFSEFQVNIFNNIRDITKCQSFCTTKMTTMLPDNDHAKAMAIRQVFSENSRAKNTALSFIEHQTSKQKKQKFSFSVNLLPLNVTHKYHNTLKFCDTQSIGTPKKWEIIKFHDPKFWDLPKIAK